MISLGALAGAALLGLLVIADQAEILGSPAPETFLGWVAALIAVWGALSAVVGLIAASASVLTKRPKLFSELMAGVLPTGWLLWGAALLHADPTLIRIAIVSGGIALMLVVAVILLLFFRKADASK